MTLQKHRLKLIAARDEMSRTIAAIDTVLAYVSIGKARTGKPEGRPLGRPPLGRPPNVKKSTVTESLKSKTRGFAKRKLTPEGEARRLAGYYAYQKRAKKERIAKMGQMARLAGA
jgi:hypothetical protein